MAWNSPSVSQQDRQLDSAIKLRNSRDATKVLILIDR